VSVTIAIFLGSARDVPFGLLTLLLGERGALKLGKGGIDNLKVARQIAEQRAILELHNQSQLVHCTSN
jgi:hypothetical protein